MVRVFYHFRVEPTDARAFEKAWETVNDIICQRCPGAHGSTLLRSDDDSSQYVGVTKWTTVDSWHTMRQSDVPSLDETDELMQHAETLSIRVMHETVAAEV